jgi:hypothetical protein
MQIKVVYDIDLITLYKRTSDILPKDISFKSFQQDKGLIRYAFSNELHWGDHSGIILSHLEVY